MKELINEINKLFHEEIISIECYSRLIHKNVVFKVSTKNNVYCVKIFLNVDNMDYRFNNELKFYQYFNETNIINVPYVYECFMSDKHNIIVMDWIDGLSLKKIIKNKNYDSIKYISKMLDDLEKIWNISDGIIKANLILDEIGLDKRLGLYDEEILSIISSYKSNIDFNNIFNIYKQLKEEIILNNNYIINSDVSVHEFINCKDKNYWIDLERFRIGDPNNDLARSFQSLTNGIYNNPNLFNDIYILYTNNKYFEEKTFLYYLIEKLLSTIYTANDQIGDEEILFYINFINDIYKKIDVKKTKIKTIS